jgi:hypothetical protein
MELTARTVSQIPLRCFGGRMVGSAPEISIKAHQSVGARNLKTDYDVRWKFDAAVTRIRARVGSLAILVVVSLLGGCALGTALRAFMKPITAGIGGP